MASRAVYAIIVIIIAIAAIGVVTLLNGNDSIKGTYELQEGSVVIMIGDDVQKQDLASQSLVIESVENGFFEADWEGCRMIGSINDGIIRFTSIWYFENRAYYENGFATIEGDVLYYTGLKITEDGSIQEACEAVFVKEGAKADVTERVPLIETGQVFTSYLRTISVDGVSSVSSDPYTMEVLDTYGSISVIKQTMSSHGRDHVFKVLGVRNGANTMECGYDSVTGFSSIITDGEVAQVNYCYSNADHFIVEKIDVTSSEKTREYAPSTELNGRMYEGRMDCLESDGTKSSYDASFSLGDDDKGVFSVYAADDDPGYTIAVSITPDSVDKGYFLNFSDRYDDYGPISLDVVRGYISADMSTLTLSYVTFNSDETVGISTSTLKLIEGNGMLGTYDLVSMESVSGTRSYVYVPDESYPYRLTVAAMNNGFVTGKFLGDDYLGVYSNNQLNFMNKKGTNYEYVSVEFYDGACAIKTMGVSGESAYSNYFKCIKEGAEKVENIPAPVRIFEVGDSLIAFGTAAKSNGQDVPMSSGQYMECTYSINGLYAFELTTSHDEMIVMNGYSESSGLIRVCGYYDRDMITYSIDRHGNQLTCLSREAVLDNGNTAAYSFRMSPDGKSIESPVCEDISGRLYTGYVSSYVLKNGLITEFDWAVLDSHDLLCRFQQNIGPITSAEMNGESIDMYIMSDEGGSINKVEYYFEVERNGTEYYAESFGVFSDGGKTLTLYSYGDGNDGSSIVMKAVLNLTER